MCTNEETTNSENIYSLLAMIFAGCFLLSPLTVSISFGQAREQDAIERTTLTLSPNSAVPDVRGQDTTPEVVGDGELSIVAGSSVNATEKGTQELSIEPGSQPMLPPDAPAWIGAMPDFSQEQHHLYIGGQIAESENEAAELIDEPLLAAVCDYVERQVLEHPGATRLMKHKLTTDFVWKNLIDSSEGYLVELNTTGVPMYQKWVTVTISPEQRELFKSWDREATQVKRLAPVGLGLLGLLGCVGVFHLILKRRS